MIHHIKRTPLERDCHDPSRCDTQLYYDRDVEFLLCFETRQCPYKRPYNNKVICDCPQDKN